MSMLKTVLAVFIPDFTEMTSENKLPMSSAPSSPVVAADSARAWPRGPTDARLAHPRRPPERRKPQCPVPTKETL